MKETTCVDTLAESIRTVILDADLLLTTGAAKLIKHSTLGIPVSNNGNFLAVLGTNDVLLLMSHLYHNNNKSQVEEILKSFRIIDVFRLERPAGLQYLNASFHPECYENCIY